MAPVSFVEIFLPFPGNPFSPWRPLADPSRASSNPFVALCRSSWPFVDILLPFPGNPSPYPTFGRPLSSLRQPLRGPSPFFVVLRGNLFAFSWKSFLSPWRPLADPSRASANPFVALRRSSWSFVEIFLPFPGNPFSPWRPLADPSRASSNPFVALCRSSWPFVDILLPFPGNPFSPWRPLADPSRASANPFVALRRSSWPFVDKSFLSVRGSSWIPSWITLFPCWSV